MSKAPQRAGGVRNYDRFDAAVAVVHHDVEGGRGISEGIAMGDNTGEHARHEGMVVKRDGARVGVFHAAGEAYGQSFATGGSDQIRCGRGRGEYRQARRDRRSERL